jgi:hypothetical protein
MNSIRPLITITILVVVGAYLYVKINEGPVQPAEESNTWQMEAPDGVPPLDTTAGAVTAGSNEPAAWESTTAQSDSLKSPDDASSIAGASQLAPATSGVATSGNVLPGSLPSVPAIPELPVPETAANAGPPTETTSVPIPNVLPESIPVARYPHEAAPRTADAVDQSPGGDTASSGTHHDQTTSTSPTTVTQPAAVAQTNDDVIDSGPTTLPKEPGSGPQPSALSHNPLRQSAPPTAKDPYATSVYGQNLEKPGTTEPEKPSFASSWPAIQTALNSGELAQALELLSPWHADPSLTPAQAKQVEALLSQLAGTVVYSTEHRLEPARVVKTGETLETIAKEYEVPWQLLAKINGIPAADRVRPGQELKVVRGPFSAVVDLNLKQLTLTVEGRYAGQFALNVPPGVEIPNGEWIVEGKPIAGEATSTYSEPASAATTGAGSRQLFLTSANPTGAESGIPLMIGSRPSIDPDFQRVGANGQAIRGTVPYLTVTPSDADELADILSIGSRVVIRR